MPHTHSDRTDSSKKRTTARYEVLKVAAKGDAKRLVIKSKSGTQSQLMLHRFAVVGEGDVIHVSPGIEPHISCEVEGGSDEITLSPAFEHYDNVQFAGTLVRSRVRELEGAELAGDIKYLEGFHYRDVDLTQSGDLQVRKGKGGRKAILVLQLKLTQSWTTVGYIEIQMPLMMAKPRHVAFDRPFKHPTLPVSWDSWRRGGQALVNRIARIARVVVGPEFRGAKISAVLVKAAITFTKQRWHIRGKRALFLEISAEMLKHVDFVSSSGFHYLGETEGNLNRIARDLVSLHKGAGGSSGIMSLQRKYFEAFSLYMRATGEDFNALLSRLTEITKSPEPWNVMTADEWIALRPLIRSPIPYYMIGLDEYSDAYVKEAAVAVPRRGIAPPRRNGEDLVVSSLACETTYSVPITDHTKLIMQGFGITTTKIVSKMFGPISFSAAPGTVVLIAGTSGSGKSSLLNALSGSHTDPNIELRGAVRGNVSVGWLRPLPSNEPIFAGLALAYGAERTFDVLSKVGLSEALLFLKPFWMLSRGQRYRAMLADLMLRDDDIWLIDEFCSDLDPLTAGIVAHRFKETVREQGRIAVVAAANNGHFIRALRPQQVINLSSAGGANVTGWKDFLSEF